MGRKKTQLEWDADVQDLVQDEYTFLEPYQGSTVKISVRHNTCGYTYSIAPKFFLKGNRCKRCVTRENAKKYTKTHKQFLQDIYTQVGNEYTVLSKYKNSSTRISVRHNICGSEYKVRPDAFLRGTRCKTCLHEEYKEKYKKTTREFAYEVNNTTNGAYKLASEYVDVNTKVKIEHIKCNTVYEVFPYQFVRGRRCPRCNQSKGEVFVENILKEQGIDYEPQKMFSNLKDINYLSYDFFLPQYNVLIEYQGVQHFKPVDVFGGTEYFRVQQRHDEMKRDYAKENGFMLIEIPYTADTYDKVKDFLSKETKFIA